MTATPPPNAEEPLTTDQMELYREIHRLRVERAHQDQHLSSAWLVSSVLTCLLIVLVVVVLANL